MNEIKISCQDFLNAVTRCSDGWFTLSMANPKTRHVLRNKIYKNRHWFDRIYASKQVVLYRLSDEYYNNPEHLRCMYPRIKISNNELYRMLLWAGYCFDNNLIIPFSFHDKANINGQSIIICPLNKIDQTKKGVLVCCESTANVAKANGLKYIIPSFAKTSVGQKALIFAYNLKDDGLIIDQISAPTSTMERRSLANYRPSNSTDNSVKSWSLDTTVIISPEDIPF